MSVPHRPHRPLIVTLLILSVFLLGIWNAGKTLAIARERTLMLALNVTLDPRIRMAIALAWTMIFGGVAGAMWRKRPFTQRALPILLAIYASTELTLQQLFAQTATYSFIWQATLFYIIWIIVAWWGLKRPSAKRYFGYIKTNQ